MFSQYKASWFLIPKLHRMCVSLNMFFFLAYVYAGKIYSNVPTAQYNSLKK